ncbi:MAG: hypothetical protein J1D87_10010 [Lachnospiraceae bacterium]|nr:hypothetical protein [Lachnospiraceae bacterium]
MKKELIIILDIVDIIFIAITTFMLCYYSNFPDKLNKFVTGMCFFVIEALILIIICNNIKIKLIRIIDVILIVITNLYLLDLSSVESYGLSALDDLGKYVLCMLLLGLYILILIVTFIIMIRKQSYEENTADEHNQQ